MTGNLDTTFAYNAEGGLTAMTYPSTRAIDGTIITPGPSYNYSYDSMYRLSGMTDSNRNTIVSGVSYNAANQLLSIDYPSGNETRELQRARPAHQSNGVPYPYAFRRT